MFAVLWDLSVDVDNDPTANSYVIWVVVLFCTGQVDIKVEVTDPEGKATQAHVEDYTQTEGCYKALLLGRKLGKHNGHVYVLGDDVNPDGFSFNVITGRMHSGATFSMKVYTLFCCILQ